MKSIKPIIFLFFAFLLFGQISAQTLLQSSTFDDGLDGYTIGSDNNWEYSPDGTADAGDGLWDDRDPIQSNSGGGAIVFKNPDADIGLITSPVYNLGVQQTAYLKFNQYYRNFQSLTQIRVTNIDNGVGQSFNINANVAQHIETGNNDIQIINITELLSQGDELSNIQITFSFEGNRYFWIVDDVQIWDDVPPPPMTNPRNHGDSLAFYGYPFEVDAADWPYVPFELVVQFSPSATEVERQAIRDTLGAIKVDSCVCDVLELWQMTDDVIVDQDGNPVPNGGTIGILERVLGSSTNSKIDGVDLNYYTDSQYSETITPPVTTIDPDDIVNIPNAPADAIRIAVLDTGVDYLHEDAENEGLNRFIYQKQSTECYENDPIGWNFVDGLNNPMDDHSHGTHVAGIIAQNIRDNGPHDCDFHIIPIKTHDLHGVSTLFQATCGTYQALEDDVSVINDSWGFYGTGSTILKNAISAALDQNVLIVSAAGNDSLNLDTLNQFPACYIADNRLAVGSIEEEFLFSEFSNFSSNWVDILAPGREILSTVPAFYDDNDVSTPIGYAHKTGTSMSTPAVSAAAAIAYCSYSDYNHVKNRILDCADNLASLSTYAINGRVLKFDVDCLTTSTQDLPSELLSHFNIFPNPTNGQLSIITKKPLENVDLKIFSVDGKEIKQHQVSKWHEGQEENINLALLPAGMYFLHIQHDDSSLIRRIVKL